MTISVAVDGMAALSPRLAACGMCGKVSQSNRNCRKHGMIHCNTCHRQTHKNKFAATGDELRAYKTFHAIKSRAARKGLAFDLDVEWIRSRLIGGRCEVTGIAFTADGKGAFSPSVDRKDASEGYVKSNCQMVVLIHNFARNEWGDEPLLEYAKRLRG